MQTKKTYSQQAAQRLRWYPSKFSQRFTELWIDPRSLSLEITLDKAD
jgi:hypothetical protein